MLEHEKHMDVGEIKEILTMISEKIPDLLNSLTDVLYGAEQAGKYGKAVAGFYKELKDSGMTDEQAFELTRQYMSSLNLAGVIDKAMRGKKGMMICRGEKEDIGKGIEELVKEKIKKKFEEE